MIRCDCCGYTEEYAQQTCDCERKFYGCGESHFICEKCILPPPNRERMIDYMVNEWYHCDKSCDEVLAEYSAMTDDELYEELKSGDIPEELCPVCSGGMVDCGGGI